MLRRHAGCLQPRSARDRLRHALRRFLPPQAQAHAVPVLYWLSGLTCTEENFIVKAGAQRVAAELGWPSWCRIPARAG